MFKGFFPKEYFDSAYAIDFKSYYDKGYRGVVLDVDNTLVEHDAPSNDKARAFFNNLREIGFKTCIISNNKEARVKPFADDVKSDYVFLAAKPKKRGYVEAMKRMGSIPETTLFVGDQIFTDVWGANRAKIFSILVKYIKLDPVFTIRLKRLAEALVLKFYNSKNRLKTD